MYCYQGIPRSPTLYISGVAISRTPEPGISSQMTESLEKYDFMKLGRGNRSSSLTTSAFQTISQIHPLGRTSLSKSAGLINMNNIVPKERSNSKKRRRDVRRLTMPALLFIGENVMEMNDCID